MSPPFQVNSSSIQNVEQFFYLDEVLASNLQAAGTFSTSFFPNDVRLRKVTSGSNGNEHLFTEATNHRITYLGSSTQGCRNFVSKMTTIHSIPDLDFAPLQGCESVVVEFEAEINNEDNLELPNGVSGMRDYLWEYLEGAARRSVLVEEPNRRFTQSFSEGQLYDITLTVTTQKGCETRLTKSIDIGIIPSPEVAWEGSTVGSPITFKVYESKLEISRTRKVQFYIEENGSILAGFPLTRDRGAKEDYLNDFTYTFQQSGLYDVVFEAESEARCKASIRRKIKVLPLHEFVDGSAYSTDFESTETDWYVDTLQITIRDVNPSISTEQGKKKVLEVERRLSSWKLGEAVGSSEDAYITQAASGSQAWFTKRPTSDEEPTIVHGYYPKERSWLYTPAFNISNLTRPTVEFSVIYNFQDKDQGVVFQYSIDDGRNWVVLGDYVQSTGSSGIEWFTHEDIDENPGDQASRRVGWAESSSAGIGEWVIARHKLGFIPRDTVRFRCAISGGADARGEGMGIDNFWIGNRTKLVLVEEFSTELTTTAREFHETVDNYLSGKDASGVDSPYASNLDAVRITYYGFPKNNPDQIVDRIYQINPEDVNARQVYYGVFDVPTAILEGDFAKNTSGQQNSALPPWTLAEFNRSALVPPEANVVFKEITVNEENISIELETSLTDRGVEQSIEGEHRLHVAVIEQQVNVVGAPSGQAVFGQVLRKMLPSAAGTPIVFDATKEVRSTTITWQVLSAYLAELDPTRLELYAIAFIQNLENKRVYQTATQRISVQKILQLGLRDEALGTYLRVYPNPSNGLLQVDFGEMQHSGLSWKITDDTGRQLLKGRSQKAVKYLQISLEELSEGTYTLLLQTVDGRTSKRRIVKSND